MGRLLPQNSPAAMLPLIFAVLLASAQGRPHDVPSHRPMPSFDIGSFIIGGSAVNIADHPHQASLQFLSGSHTCGAAIISTTRLACAAHCTQGSAYQISVGSSNRREGTVVSIASIRNHPAITMDKLEPSPMMCLHWRPLYL